MRAAVMRNKRLVAADLPRPDPGPGEVLVKTLACGICGSDLHALRHAEQFVAASRRAGSVFTMDLARDVVMGHEFCAEVVEHGPGTTGALRPGTRVCSRPSLIRAPALPPWVKGPSVRPAVVFECVGVPGVLDQLMAASPRGTRIVVVGVCMEADTIYPMLGISKELNLQFVLGYTPDEFAATLGHIAEGRIPVAPLITGKVGVEGVAGAFEALASPERHAKILVEPWRA